MTVITKPTLTLEAMGEHNDKYAVRKARKAHRCVGGWMNNAPCPNADTIKVGEWHVENYGGAPIKMSGPRLCVECAVAAGLVTTKEG